MAENRYLSHDWFPRPLPANIEIGPRSWIYGTFAFIHYFSRRPIGLRVGHDSGIYNPSFFELGCHGEVAIGNYCALVATIIRTNGRVEIGDYSFIAHEVVIADDSAALPPTAEGARQELPLGNEMVIGPNVWIGAHAILLGQIRIGEGSIVGAGAVVTDSVPPYTVVAGNPARIVRTINQRGSQH
ncbi:acyltransferase [Candidatus Poribacteria bacterium]